MCGGEGEKDKERDASTLTSFSLYFILKQVLVPILNYGVYPLFRKWNINFSP